MKKKLNTPKRSLAKDNSLSATHKRQGAWGKGRAAVADWASLIDVAKSKRLAKLATRARALFWEADRASDAASHALVVRSAGLGLALLERVHVIAGQELAPEDASKLIKVLLGAKQHLVELVAKAQAASGIAHSEPPVIIVPQEEPGPELPEQDKTDEDVPPADRGNKLLRHARRSELLKLKGVGPKIVLKILGKNLEDVTDIGLPRKVLDLLTETYYC